jgi:hypothetical protein
LRAGLLPAALIVALCAAALLPTGCARAPEAGEPISGGELADIVAGIPGASGVEALRASGEGRALLNGRWLTFEYASVYDRPGWLRADARPGGARAGAAFAVALLLDGPCARGYLPARALEARGCFEGTLGMLGDLDAAGLLLGVIDPRLATSLERPTVRREADRTVVEGALGGLRAGFELRGDPPRLRAFSVRGPDGLVEIEYSGEATGASGVCPERVDLKYEGAGGEALVLRLSHRSVKALGHVRRADYEFSVPVGTRTVDWHDIQLGRSK